MRGIFRGCSRKKILRNLYKLFLNSSLLYERTLSYLISITASGILIISNLIVFAFRGIPPSGKLFRFIISYLSSPFAAACHGTDRMPVTFHGLGTVVKHQSMSRMILRTGRIEDGLMDSSSIPILTNSSVSSGSAPSSPQIPTQVLCLWPASMVILIARRTAG